MKFSKEVIAFLTITSLAVIVAQNPKGISTALAGLTKLLMGVSKTSQGRG